MYKIFKKISPHTSVIFISLLFLTLLSFNYNFFGFSDDKFYSDFQKDSELLVESSIFSDKFSIDKHNRGLGTFIGETCFILPNAECSFFLTDQNWSKGVSKLNASFFVQNQETIRGAIHVGNLVRISDFDIRKVESIDQNRQYLNVGLSGDGPLSKFTNKLPLEFKINSNNSSEFKALGNYIDKPTFSNYDSQYGIQGRFFSKLSRVIDVYSVSGLRLFTAVVTGIVIVLLTFSYSRVLNRVYAATFFVVLVSSPWVISFAPNLYWVPFTWFLPALVTVFLYEKIDSSLRVRFILLASYFFVVFIKCLAGYEYLSSIVLLATSIFLVTPLFKNEKIKRIHINYFVICSLVSVCAFFLALLIHANMRADNIFEGLKIIFEQDVKRRTYGNAANFDPVYTNSLTVNPLYVVKNYIINWKTSLFFYFPGEIFKIFFSSILFIFTYALVNNKVEAYGRKFIILGIYFSIPISWFVLAKGHSFIHTHMNYVLWYLGFIPMMVYYFYDEIRGFIFKLTN